MDFGYVREPEKPPRTISSLFGLAPARARVLDFLFGIKHAEVARVDAARHDNAFRRQTAFQELSNGGGAARHSLVETPIVERRQFLVREHDLQTFAARQALPSRSSVQEAIQYLVSCSKSVKGAEAGFLASYSFSSDRV